MHVYVCLYECVCVPYVFEWGPVCVYACRADPLQLVCVCAALTLSSGWVCLCVFVCERERRERRERKKREREF